MWYTKSKCCLNNKGSLRTAGARLPFFNLEIISKQPSAHKDSGVKSWISRDGESSHGGSMHALVRVEFGLVLDFSVVYFFGW